MDSLIPEKIFKLGEKIPLLRMQFFRETLFHAVNIESPSNFYVHIKKKEISDAFQIYEHFIEEFYENNSHIYKIKNFSNVEKLICVFKTHFNNGSKWLRGQILYCLNNEVIVRSLDYGSNFEISDEKVFYLIKDFGVEVPEQAINCRLRNIIPRNLKFWNKNELNFFKDIFKNYSDFGFLTFEENNRTAIGEILDYQNFSYLNLTMTLSGLGIFELNNGYYPSEE